jgi:AcrR family transcriptional regulator
MTGEKIDRRVQRTRDLLRRALMQLIVEKGYDAITIQDITGRANLGRTTFYLHYQSKDDLLLDHHTELLELVKLEGWTREELLSEAVADGLVAFLERVSAGRGIYMAINSAKDGELIRRRQQEQMVENLADSITHAFPDRMPRMPLDVLCNYVVGAQLALIKWWMTQRNDYSAMHIAHMIQRLQYAAIRDAYQLD